MTVIFQTIFFIHNIYIVFITIAATKMNTYI